MICSNAVDKRTDNRNSAAYRSLEEEIAVILSCQLKKFVTALGNNFLVRGTYTLAGLKSLNFICMSRLNASHTLSYTSYLIIVEDIVEVLGELVLIRRIREICTDVFRSSSPERLDTKGLASLVRRVHSRYGCTRKQLMRLLPVDETLLDRIL